MQRRNFYIFFLAAIVFDSYGNPPRGQSNQSNINTLQTTTQNPTGPRKNNHNQGRQQPANPITQQRVMQTASLTGGPSQPNEQEDKRAWIQNAVILGGVVGLGLLSIWLSLNKSGTSPSVAASPAMPSTSVSLPAPTVVSLPAATPVNTPVSLAEIPGTGLWINRWQYQMPISQTLSEKWQTFLGKGVLFIGQQIVGWSCLAGLGWYITQGKIEPKKILAKLGRMVLGESIASKRTRERTENLKASSQCFAQSVRITILEMADDHEQFNKTLQPLYRKAAGLKARMKSDKAHIIRLNESLGKLSTWQENATKVLADLKGEKLCVS